jgi:hypothetical protein
MLALLVSFLVAVYVFGPDLISRWVLGFVVPRKNLVQSRGEEVTRAILWAAIPLAAAVWWASWTGALAHHGTVTDVETVFSGLESDAFFRDHRGEFFLSLRAFFIMNLCLLWRLYALVISFAIVFNLLILRYNRIWGWFKSRWIRSLLSTIVLPRVSEWHVLLSGMLLPPGRFMLTADVLTKANALYQGRVQDKMLNADGSLHSITLANPRRFLREEFQEARHAKQEHEDEAHGDEAHGNRGRDDQGIKSSDYWISVPGNLFIMMGSDIANLNLKYIRQKPLSFEPSDEEKIVLTRLLERLSEPKR